VCVLGGRAEGGARFIQNTNQVNRFRRSVRSTQPAKGPALKHPSIIIQQSAWYLPPPLPAPTPHAPRRRRPSQREQSTTSILLAPLLRRRLAPTQRASEKRLLPIGRRTLGLGALCVRMCVSVRCWMLDVGCGCERVCTTPIEIESISSQISKSSPRLLFFGERLLFEVYERRRGHQKNNRSKAERPACNT
jgi:hypothetical protein